MIPKCPKCESTRVSGKYVSKILKYCGYRWEVDRNTGEEIKRKKVR